MGVCTEIGAVSVCQCSAGGGDKLGRWQNIHISGLAWFSNVVSRVVRSSSSDRAMRLDLSAS